MKKKWKNIFTTFLACAGLSCAFSALGDSIITTDAEETQKVLQSNSIIKTTALGDIDVSSLRIKDGAAIRLKDTVTPDTDDPEQRSRNGLRFTGYINRKVYNKLEELDAQYDNVSVGYGMLIVPYDYLATCGDLTVENIFGETANYYVKGRVNAEDIGERKKIAGWFHADLPEEDDDTREREIYCSIINIQKNQLTREWVGVAYIEYTEDGVSQYYMTEVKANDTEAKKKRVRSMTYVAQRALQANDSNVADCKDWVKQYYTTYQDTTVDIPSKQYTYTVNHILVDPLGNETIDQSTVYTKENINTPVTVNEEKSYDGYTLDDERTVTSDIVYANNRTELNYYYNQEHCDVIFNGTRCTMQVDGKEGEHLTYIALNTGATEFVFTVEPVVGFSSGTALVKIDGEEVAADANGNYTISLTGKKHGDVITIDATVNAGTVSDQVFEDTNYGASGVQSSLLGTIAGWLGYGDLQVDEAAGTIKTNGGSLELDANFIKNALTEGYTHMVCDVEVTKTGIGTFKKLEMINGGKTAVYQKVSTDKARTDRIDLTEFEKDGTYSSLIFRAYRTLLGREAVSSSATVQISNIRLYRSAQTAKWKKYNKDGQEITNAYVAYENGDLTIETMEDGTYFQSDTDMIAYDLAVDVSMSFAFKYLRQGENGTSFFYRFSGQENVKENALGTCRIDEKGYYHLCILPETVKAQPDGSTFFFGLEKPGAAIIARSNAGVATHNKFVDGQDTGIVLADTWGYPYGNGIYNEFLQVKDEALAREGVQFNVNTYDNHTMKLTITSDVDFRGFWYGNNVWEGYQAGMKEFTEDDVDVVTYTENGVSVTTYMAEIVYSSPYMANGFYIHWRGADTNEQGVEVGRTGTMKLHYTLQSHTSFDYSAYAFSPDKHEAGVFVEDTLIDGVKVESLTGVAGTIFTMPVFNNEVARTITLTVSADWNFNHLSYGTGDTWYAFNPHLSDKKYTQTVSLKAVYTDGFKIKFGAFGDNLGVGTAKIDVIVGVDNFIITGTGVVKVHEVQQTQGWTNLKLENVQKQTTLDFDNMPTTDSISVYLTSNINFANYVTYGTKDKQMIKVQSVSYDEDKKVYVAQFTYCNPAEGYEGFRIALDYQSNNSFPADAYMQVQYRFTDFKIQNTEDIVYTNVLEREITKEVDDEQQKWTQATLYSQSTNARFWLNTTGYVQIKGTITSSVELFEGVLLYGHGWDTTGVVAIDPSKVTKNGDGTWSYEITYGKDLQSGFCIYFAENNGQSFSGTVQFTYQLYTMEQLTAKSENWRVESGATALEFHKNGHIVYGEKLKTDGVTGHEIYLDKTLVEMAYNNGYQSVGVTFASNDVIKANILNGNGVSVTLLKDGTIEHIQFRIALTELYKTDENGTLVFSDLVLRFDSADEKQTEFDVTIEDIEFSTILPRS